MVSPVSVAQVHSAFAEPEYWRARFEEFGTDTTLERLDVDSAGAVQVEMTVHLTRQFLPAALTKMIPADLTMSHRETWRPVDDGRVYGEISISAPGARGGGSASAWLSPADAGSQLRFTATVQVKVPVVGGRIERFVGAQLAENIPAIQHFTTGWITGHA